MSRSTADSSSSAALPHPKERRSLREALGLSEEQVAEAMGVTKATVKAWENGRSAPRGRKREAYAKLLGGTRAPDGPSPSSSSSPEAATGAALTPSAPSPEDSSPEAPSPTASSWPPEGLRPGAAVKRAAKPPRVLPESSERRKRAEPEPGPAGPEQAEPQQVAPEAAEVPAGPGLTPEEAFDALYAHAAPALVHQTYLLTGRRALSREAVERAFQQAWQRWPEVAVDADPVGWVRAAAYEYALSPWHRLRRAHRHADAPPTGASRRALLSALLELPPPYRRTVLLYDGLGLDLPDTAAETEASTPAAANRLLHARTVLGKRVPELSEPEELHRRLSALVAEAPTATVAEPRAVRSGSDRRADTWTRAVIGFTAALIAVTGFTVVTAPTRYIPVNAPGETVNGVPVRGGPQKLAPEDVRLRDKLRSEPNPGPERLLPAAE